MTELKMPKHAKYCAFLEDTHAHCTCKTKFNGKPFSHWQKEADRLVVDGLIRASMLDARSIIGKLASARLLNLAYEESSELVKEVLEDRSRCQVGMAIAMAEMTGLPLEIEDS